MTKKTNKISIEPPTPLSAELTDRITRAIHEGGMAPGARLNELQLARQLGVSRTPVRTALEYMAALGFVQREPNRGMKLLARPPLRRAAPEPEADDDALLLRISRDRYQRRLPDYVTEKDLMEAYALTRPAVKNALERLADLGVVERKLGYGWRFVADAWDEATREESYRFRMVIEPAAIRESGFALPPGWAADMRRQHRAFLALRWTESSSIAFFEMNAAFHEGLAAASGNRFFVASIQRQNRVRRLSNYDWRHGRERVEVNVREHLEMLDRLEAGDTEMAALLMRRHLETARQLRTPASLDP